MSAMRKIGEYLGLLVWMGLPPAALGWVFGHHVVELLYGAAFAPAGRYFEWLCYARDHRLRGTLRLCRCWNSVEYCVPAL